MWAETHEGSDCRLPVEVLILDVLVRYFSAAGELVCYLQGRLSFASCAIREIQDCLPAIKNFVTELTSHIDSLIEIGVGFRLTNRQDCSCQIDVGVRLRSRIGPLIFSISECLGCKVERALMQRKSSAGTSGKEC